MRKGTCCITPISKKTSRGALTLRLLNTWLYPRFALCVKQKRDHSKVYMVDIKRREDEIMSAMIGQAS